MLIIKPHNLVILSKMRSKWTIFKKKRNAKEFDKGPVSGFLTMFDRENMIDRLFDILTNGLEEVDGQANQ